MQRWVQRLGQLPLDLLNGVVGNQNIRRISPDLSLPPGIGVQKSLGIPGGIASTTFFLILNLETLGTQTRHRHANRQTEVTFHFQFLFTKEFIERV